MSNYSIVRLFQDSAIGVEPIETGLTLDEAQEWCQDPETSSSPCELPENIARTEKYGMWFDAYQEDV